MYKINYLNQKTSQLSQILDKYGKVLLFNNRKDAIDHKNSILTHKSVIDGVYDVVIDAEFKTGDSVTFKPYEKACKCKVIAVQQGMHGDGKHIDGTPDTRIFYKLSGEAISVCSGLSIVESKLYKNES